MAQLLYPVRPTLTATASALIPRNAVTSSTEWNSAIIRNTSGVDVNIGVAGVTNADGFTLPPDSELHLTDLAGSDDVFELYGVTSSSAAIQVLLSRR